MTTQATTTSQNQRDFTDAGYTQSAIDVGLQQTSNLIGENVINEILSARGMPVFGVMISQDISAAIGNSNLSSDFRQDVGGWGGSFYYWQAPLHYLKPDQTTVGTVIRQGGIVESLNASLKEFSGPMRMRWWTSRSRRSCRPACRSPAGCPWSGHRTLCANCARSSRKLSTR